MIKSKDPIMSSIKEYAKDNNIDAVNAKIEDDYIIPGMYGKRVNEVKSLMSLKSLGIFNSTFLIFDDIKPEVSLNNNKDKIIISGNPKKKSISLVLENDESNTITYLISNKINASLLVDVNSVNKNPFFEQINNDFDNYSKVESVLNKGKINTNICILGRSNEDFCLRNKKYIVKPSKVLSSGNVLSIKKSLTSGDILLVKDSVDADDINIIIEYLKSKDIKLVKLSDLISEKIN